MKDLYNKTVYGIGYIGEGNYKITINKQRTNISNTWKNMLQRCYKGLKTHPSYIGVTVCDEWHNFQNFAEWFQQNHIKGFVLDKDILIKGNKIYSTKTCCFVPEEINYLFLKCNKKRGVYPIGVSLVHKKFQVTLRKNRKTFNLGRFNTIEEAFQVYKVAKEQYIKEVADKWKEFIDPRVYEAMYNYQVEITD
jgi:hypothetical protein